MIYQAGYPIWKFPVSFVAITTCRALRPKRDRGWSSLPRSMHAAMTADGPADVFADRKRAILQEFAENGRPCTPPAPRDPVIRLFNDRELAASPNDR
jgi:hypothetical protein